MITLKCRPAHPTPPPPRTQQGQLYRYEMIYDAGHRRAYANTLTELCTALIQEYDPDTITAQQHNQHQTAAQRDSHTNRALDRLRILYTIKVQTWLQALINSQADLNQLTPHQQAVLRGHRTTQPAINHWNASVPLVLSAHEYQPHGPLTKPDGNIIWINPRDEQTLLTTLNTAGWIHLNQTPPTNHQHQKTPPQTTQG